MKKILILGKTSYIGTALAKYLAQPVYRDRYEVTSISVRDDSWKQVDFSAYDSIFMAAGKAHADVGKVSDAVKEEYYEVNSRLPKAIAEKARADWKKRTQEDQMTQESAKEDPSAEGKQKSQRTQKLQRNTCGQFIYPSSVIIYGESAPYGHKKMITADTIPAPANFYGDSKLQGDQAIAQLNSTELHTVVLRLPMVYGRESKGNYPLLAKLAKKLPFFPRVENQRSMIYIGNLCECIRQIIDHNDEGIFYPQNADYISTSDMVNEISHVVGKSMLITGILTPFVRIASRTPGKIGRLANKAFGNCTYEKSLSEYRGNTYQKYSFQRSIEKTEGKTINKNK